MPQPYPISTFSGYSFRGAFVRFPWQSGHSACTRECPLLAQSGHFTAEFRCLLLGV